MNNNNTRPIHSIPPPNKQPPLPPGWEEAHDPGSGRVYFANRSTGETRWVRPTLPPPPPIPNINSSTYYSLNASTLPVNTSTFMQYGQVIPNNPFSPDVPNQSQKNAMYSSSSILPVPSVLGMMYEEQLVAKNVSDASRNKIELEKMTGGKLSDLFMISMQHNPNREPYEPLDIASLPIDSRPPVIEPGRLEVRLAALYEALGHLVY